MGRRSTPSVGGTLLLLWVAGLAAISPSAQAARALSGRSMLVTTGRTLHAASVDSGSGGSGGAQQCDSAAMLDALNALRAEHGAPPLSWSDDLAQQAVDVARQQADNPSCQFQFALTSHGESQAKWTGLDCVGSVELWKGEEPKYTATGGGSYVPEAASFTQIVWKSTTQVGCAYVMGGCDGSDMGYVSCLYDPPGNYNGGFEENVSMGGGDTNSSTSTPQEQGGGDGSQGGGNDGQDGNTENQGGGNKGQDQGGDQNGGDQNGGDQNGGDQNGGGQNGGGDQNGGDQNGGDQNGGDQNGGDQNGGGQNGGGDQNGGNQQDGGNNQQGSCDVQATLDAHNAARAKHGAAPLTWDATLAEYALGVVNSQDPVDCKLVHSNGPYGENLAYGTNFGCPDAVALWMQEEAQWVPGTDHFVSGQGHYTQIVWKATTGVGCAMVPNKCGGFNYVACSYNPPGNMAGGFVDNVQ